MKNVSPPACPEDGNSGRLEASASSGEMNENNRDGPPRASQNTTREERHEGQALDGGRESGANPTVTLAVIERRFFQAKRAKLRERTAGIYSKRFSAFAKKVGLQGYDKRQLEGRKGRDLILAYLEGAGFGRATWRWELSAIRCVWEAGMEAAWPIVPSRDLPRLPPTRPLPTPADHVVKVWAEAIRLEADPLTRVRWLLVAQTGWRPSHVCKVRWGHIRHKADGTPHYIHADGAKEDFKTSAPVIARLAPDLARALKEWEANSPNASAGALIAAGKAGTLSKADSLTKFLIEYGERKKLPPLRPRELRHWVATACRKAGLSRPASAALMGHDMSHGGSMRDWYDQPPLEELLIEQEERLPNGPLGLLIPPEIRLDGPRLPAEAVAAVTAFMDGKLGTLEAMRALEDARRSAQPKPFVPTSGR